MKLILSLLLLIPILLSCKKEEPTSNDSSSETNNNTPTQLNAKFMTWELSGQPYNGEVDIYLDDNLIGSPSVYYDIDVCNNPSTIVQTINVNTTYNVKLKNGSGTILQEEEFEITIDASGDYVTSINVVQTTNQVNFDIGWNNCNGNYTCFLQAYV